MLALQSKQYLLDTDIFDVENIAGRPNGIEIVGIAIGDELPDTRYLTCNPLHVGLVCYLIRREDRLLRNDAQLVKETTASIQMTGYSHSLPLVNQIHKIVDTEEAGHRQQKWKLSYKLVVLITDQLITETVGVVADARKCAEERASEFPQDRQRFEVAQYMDFLPRRNFHTGNEEDAGSIECARKSVCVTACIVVCHGCDTDSPGNQPGRDLTWHHGDVGAGRQT